MSFECLHIGLSKRVLHGYLCMVFGRRSFYFSTPWELYGESFLNWEHDSMVWFRQTVSIGRGFEVFICFLICFFAQLGFVLFFRILYGICLHKGCPKIHDEGSLSMPFESCMGRVSSWVSPRVYGMEEWSHFAQLIHMFLLLHKFTCVCLFMVCECPNVKGLTWRWFFAWDLSSKFWSLHWKELSLLWKLWA